MKDLFECADEYLQGCDWKDMAMIKCCLFSMGILAGMQIAKKNQEKVRKCFSVVFVMTYVFSMTKFLNFVINGKNAGEQY